MLLFIMFITYMVGANPHYSHQYDSPDGKKTCVFDCSLECHDKEGK